MKLPKCNAVLKKTLNELGRDGNNKFKSINTAATTTTT